MQGSREASKQGSKQACMQDSKQAGMQGSRQAGRHARMEASKEASKQAVGALPCRCLLFLQIILVLQTPSIEIHSENIFISTHIILAGQ